MTRLFSNHPPEYLERTHNAAPTARAWRKPMHTRMPYARILSLLGALLLVLTACGPSTTTQLPAATPSPTASRPHC